MWMWFLRRCRRHARDIYRYLSNYFRVIFDSGKNKR